MRSLATGHAPPLPFVAVAGGFSLVMMMGWRVGYAAVTPPSKVELYILCLPRRHWCFQDSDVAKGNRKGNPFEFLKFLNSIVRRW